MDVEDWAVCRVAELRQSGADPRAFVAMLRLADGQWSLEVVRGDGSTEQQPPAPLEAPP